MIRCSPHRDQGVSAANPRCPGASRANKGHPGLAGMIRRNPHRDQGVSVSEPPLPGEAGRIKDTGDWLE
jgi:hypothetical protein